ncbi:MAG: triosephosphate isomerase [Aaplasma endosymbiont of Hyalomma asiaticum]
MPFLVIANWKTNGSAATAREFVEAICPAYTSPECCRSYRVVLCPPFTAMPFLSSYVQDMDLGGQDCFSKAGKSCTGEISPSMLRECGCKYVILGHSDRRQILNEDNSCIKLKATGAIEEGLTPIICVGETKSERDRGDSASVLFDQCSSCFPDNGEFIVAYEPVWAIGGLSIPELSVIDDAFKVIRSHNPKHKIVYGGSVNGSNIFSLKNGISGIDGVLVGNASLNVDSFGRILDNLMECL